MNCQKAGTLLSGYLDHELSPEERRQLRLHLLVCAECTQELRDLEEIKTSLGGLCVDRLPEIIPALRRRLAAEVAEAAETAAPPLVWQYSWFRRTCATVAVLLLVALGSWLLAPQPQRRNAPAGQPSLPSMPNASWVRYSGWGR